MIEYTLDDEEMEIVYTVAIRRNINSINNRKSMKRSDDNDLNINIMGVAGEYVVSKAYKRFFDIKTKYDNDYLPPYDLILPNGKTADVKTTEKHHQKYLIKVGKSAYADIFIFVVGSMPTFKIEGWARREDIIKQDNIVDFGKGASYAIDAVSLHPIKPKER